MLWLGLFCAMATSRRREAATNDPTDIGRYYLGDAGFGMTGLDFETAVRSKLLILTVVLNNSTMAVEIESLSESHAKYRTRNLGGNYAEMARAMGGWAERVEDPGDVAPAILRAKKATEEGRAALLEFLTSAETSYSHREAFG